MKKGVIYGVLTFAMYLAFTCFVFCFFDGMTFVEKGETREAINGISFTTVQVIGGVLSALIPMLFVKYKSFDSYCLSMFVGAVSYTLLFVTVFFVGLSLMPSSLVQVCPLNSFDALIYGVYVFPLGAVVGMAVTPIVNYLMKKKSAQS